MIPQSNYFLKSQVSSSFGKSSKKDKSFIKEKSSLSIRKAPMNISNNQNQQWPCYQQKQNWIPQNYNKNVSYYQTPPSQDIYSTKIAGYEFPADNKNNQIFYKSSVSSWKVQKPQYDYNLIKDQQKYVQLNKSKSRAKTSTKSFNTIPLYQRLKNPVPLHQFQYSNDSAPSLEQSVYRTHAKSMRKKTKTLRDTCQQTSILNKNSSFKNQIQLRSTVGPRNTRKLETDYSRPFSTKPEQSQCDLRATPCFNWKKDKKYFNTDVYRQPKLEDFILGDCKGQGRFGKVYLAVHKQSGFVCALKKIRKQSVRFMMDQFIQELKIQQFLNHPNLVKIYGYFADNQNFYMLVEYMEEGCLYSLLKKNSKKLSQLETSQKLFQICSGIKEMHQNSIVHRDLKPQNVVITHGVCKVCDFGWAAVCQDRRSTYCGTLDYVCPEIVGGQQYDSSVDIWCLGVLAYQMMCGKAPFYDISRKKTMQNIKSCKIQSFPSHLSAKAISFIGMILQKNPQSRVSIKQLLSSQFILTTAQ